MVINLFFIGALDRQQIVYSLEGPFCSFFGAKYRHKCKCLPYILETYF